MKKILLFVFCLLSYFNPAFGCSPGFPDHGNYITENGQLLYEYSDNEPILIKGADISTLDFLDEVTRKIHKELEEPLSRKDRKLYYTDYVKDKNHVYYKGKIFKGTNPAQAEFMEQRFDQLTLIDGLDQYTTSDDWNKDDGYLKDDSNVYYFGQLIKGANGKHFEWLPFTDGKSYAYKHDYARDDQHIYLYGHKVAGEAKTAAAIEYGYYLDAKHIYFRGEVLENARPDAFELKGVFIVSNGHVYYRAQQLALDAKSFEILQHMHGSPVVSCGGTTYAGSFNKDRNGIYALHATGKLNRLEQVSDTAYINHESVRLEKGSGHGSYRDKQSIYFFSNTVKGSGTLESLFEGNSKTFEPYAALEELIIFKDKTGFYLPNFYYWGGPQLLKIMHEEAKLVCMESNHLCLLGDNTLYYIFDDGTVQQIQVDTDGLQCIKGETLPESLAVNARPGMCFDYSYFYDRGGRKRLKSGDYRELPPHSNKSEDLEKKRIESLKKIKNHREPQFIDKKPESDNFQRMHFL